LSTKKPLSDKDYLLCIGVAGIVYSLVLVEMLHTSELVNNIVGESQTKVSALPISGYIILHWRSQKF